MLDGYTSASQHVPDLCNWCAGSGERRYVHAYVPGADPFDFGRAETVSRLGNCRSCRGTGTYDARRDPALQHLPRDND